MSLVQEPVTTIAIVPPEILALIAIELTSDADVRALCLLKKSATKLMNDNHMWHARLLKKFPNYPFPVTNSLRESYRDLMMLSGCTLGLGFGPLFAPITDSTVCHYHISLMLPVPPFLKGANATSIYTDINITISGPVEVEIAISKRVTWAGALPSLIKDSFAPVVKAKEDHYSYFRCSCPELRVFVKEAKAAGYRQVTPQLLWSPQVTCPKDWAITHPEYFQA